MSIRIVVSAGHVCCNLRRRWGGLGEAGEVAGFSLVSRGWGKFM